MPLLKRHQKSESLVKVSDKKADKSGVLHTVYSVNGDEYTGEWLNNHKHGKGTQVCRRAGLLYDGGWKFGKREGFGTLSTLHSDTYSRVYVGEWRNNKKEGFGTQFYGPNSYYEGQWAEHKRSGWGRMFYPNGDFYEGDWLNDKPHGHGLLRLVCEDRYEGCWVNGVKHGAGQYYYVSRAQVCVGFWVNNVMKCGTLTDTSPDSTHIPQVELVDADAVLMEAMAEIRETDDH